MPIVDEWHAALDRSAEDLLAAFTDNDFRLLQRELRGFTESEWLAARDKLMPWIPDFIRQSPVQRRVDYPDDRVRATLKLASWQLVCEMESLLRVMGENPISRSRRPQVVFPLLASASVDALLLSQRTRVLWPFDIGSPFFRR